MNQQNMPELGKLEFGNKEQIKKIDEFIHKKEEAAKMWEVEISIHGDSTIRVIAENEDEARDKAQDLISDGMIDYEIEIGFIRKLSEKEAMGQ